jgi:hypothetical protein
MNLREKILAAADKTKWPRKTVVAWGETIMIRPLDAGESIRLLDYAVKDDGKVDMAKYDSRLIVLSCEDAGGNRIFQDGDEAGLLQLEGDDFAAVVEAARELNGQTAKAREDAEKNSPPIPAGG